MTRPIKQRIFDRVWTAFVVEGAPASRGDGSLRCLYRGPNGAKCAIGVCIPDELYDPRMEDCSSWSIVEEFPVLRPHLGDDEDFLDDLQSAHDSATTAEYTQGYDFREQVEARLRKVAKEQGLEVPS